MTTIKETFVEKVDEEQEEEDVEMTKGLLTGPENDKDTHTIAPPSTPLTWDEIALLVFLLGFFLGRFLANLALLVYLIVWAAAAYLIVGIPSASVCQSLRVTKRSQEEEE